jgi:hypothetical protein
VLEFGCQISLDHHWQNICINLIKLALPNKMICILPDAKFWQYFRSSSRNLKFHQWHPLWLYLCSSHISEKYGLHQSGLSIYHLDQISKEVLNLNIWSDQVINNKIPAMKHNNIT